MSFRIFVRGSRGFTYERSNVSDGADWDMGWMEGQILARTNTNFFPFLGYRPSPRSSNTYNITRQSLNAIGNIERLNLLIEVITLVMVNGDGTINISINHEHFAWPSTGNFYSISMYGDNPDRVVRLLLNFLKENGMNKWGPFIEITNSLSQFASSYLGGRNNINITFSD